MRIIRDVYLIGYLFGLLVVSGAYENFIRTFMCSPITWDFGRDVWIWIQSTFFCGSDYGLLFIPTILIILWAGRNWGISNLPIITIGILYYILTCLPDVAEQAPVNNISGIIIYLRALLCDLGVLVIPLTIYTLLAPRGLLRLGCWILIIFYLGVIWARPFANWVINIFEPMIEPIRLYICYFGYYALAIAIANNMAPVVRNMPSMSTNISRPTFTIEQNASDSKVKNDE